MRMTQVLTRKSSGRPAAAWSALILAVCLAAWAVVSPLCLPAAAVAEPARNTLVFISDTQAPSFFEALRLKKERNEEATRAIFDRVLREKDEAAVFLLGDMTRAASTDSNWREVDRFLAGLKQAGIPCYAALGNHSYMWSSKKGLANFRKRFPGSSTWYTVTIGPAAVIILNSNFKELTPEEQAAQQSFYEKALRNFDEDPHIRGVLVGCHHSPFTNSRTISPDKRVETDFVAPFLKSKKGLLFLTGHAHAAEHFVKQGKNFLVLGGGGGLRHKVLLPPNRPYQDIFPLQSEKRPYHYLTVQLGEQELVVTYQALTQDLSAFEPVHRFTLSW